MDTNTNTNTASDRTPARLRWVQREAALAALLGALAVFVSAWAGNVSLTLFCALGFLLVQVLNTRTRAVVAETALSLRD